MGSIPTYDGWGSAARARIVGPAPQGSREVAIASFEDVRAGLAEHLPRLWRYALFLSRRRDVADDLVQSTCLRALERAGQFQAGTRIDRWLVSILHSIWSNETRAQRVRSGNGLVDASQTLSFDGEAQVQSDVVAAQIQRLVETLPDAQRTAVFLAYVEGLSYREVAEATGVPIGTVMSRLASARLTLADRLGAGPGKTERQKHD